jgi:hypothetical protein
VIVPCHFCKQPMSTTTPGTYRKATGWIESRLGGGSNALRLPQQHDEWAHRGCIDREKRGHVWGQSELFPPSEAA